MKPAFSPTAGVEPWLRLTDSVQSSLGSSPSVPDQDACEQRTQGSLLSLFRAFFSRVNFIQIIGNCLGVLDLMNNVSKTDSSGTFWMLDPNLT